jgi:hypothetical protein
VGVSALVAVLAAWPAAAKAQSQTDGLVHGAVLRFGQASDKRAGHQVGLYATLGRDWRELIEAGVVRTTLDYRDGSRFAQTGLAGAYNRFGARASGRVGVHGLDSDDPITGGGVIVFGGVSVYRPGVWSAGAEVAHSRYPNAGAGLGVWQVAPSVGWTARDASATRVLSAVLRGYAIGLSDDAGLDSRRFGSGEATVIASWRGVSASAFGWAGRQAFAVRQGGFLVFNVAEERRGGGGGGLRWVVTPTSAVSAGAWVERLLDADSRRETRVVAFTAGYGFTF